MAILTINQVKALFEEGDQPSESDFIDLIDTLAAFPIEAPVYDTVAELRAAGVPEDNRNTAAITKGCNLEGDNGGGLWYWDDSETSSDNTGQYLLPTGHTGDGRWVRASVGFYTPDMFGATADATWDTNQWTGTDQTAIIQACEDAAYAEGYPIYWKGGNYFVDGTINKRAAVSWYGVKSTLILSAGTGTNLCPGPGSSSKTGSNQKWSNAVIDIDVDTYSLFEAYVDIIGVNILGAPEGTTTASLRNGRCGLSAANIVGLTWDGSIVMMDTAISIISCNTIKLNGGIFYCGDDSNARYALDLRLDPRQSGGVGGANYLGRIEDAIITISIRANELFAQVSTDTGSDILFQATSFVDTQTSARTNSPISILAGTNTLQFKNCRFDTSETTAGAYFLNIANSNTAFESCTFTGDSGLIEHTGDGLRINNCEALLVDPDRYLFSFRDRVYINNLVVNHNIASITERRCIKTDGDVYFFTNLFFSHIGTAGTLLDTVGLVELGVGAVTSSYPETVNIQTGSTGGLGTYGAIASCPSSDAYNYIKIQNFTDPLVEADSSFWASGAEMDSTGSGDVMIFQKKRCAEIYLMNPSSNVVFDGLFQGTIGEVITLATKGTASGAVIVSTNANLITQASPDTIAAGEFKRFVCLNANYWYEL